MVSLVIGSYTFTDRLRNWGFECSAKNPHHEVPHRQNVPTVDGDVSRLTGLEYTLIVRLTDEEIRDLEVEGMNYSDLALNINSGELTDTVNLIGLDSTKQMGMSIDSQLNVVKLTLRSVAGGIVLA